jgi:hypothetical protein
MTLTAVTYAQGAGISTLRCIQRRQKMKDITDHSDKAEVFDIAEAQKAGGFSVVAGVDPRNEHIFSNAAFGTSIEEHQADFRGSMKYSPAYHDEN